MSDTELVAIDLTLLKTASQLLNRILAISQAEDDAGDEAIVGSPVLGFVYMFVPSLHPDSVSLVSTADTLNLWHRSATDTVKKKVTILSPLPGRLPRKTLLLASLNWQDS